MVSLEEIIRNRELEIQNIWSGVDIQFNENKLLDNNFGCAFGPDNMIKINNDLNKETLSEIEKLKEEKRKLQQRKKDIENGLKEIESVKKENESVKKENEYLIKKNSDLLDDKDINMEYICVICMTDTKNCLLEPCGHLATCLSCYIEGKLKTCPCCRTTITKMRKIFI
jgi:FtsZ-binding cell division protein ZapB